MPNIEHFTPLGLSFVLTCVLVIVLIQGQHRSKIFQFIRPEGPASHHSKNKTPTAGGLAIVLGQLFFLKAHIEHLFIFIYCLSLALFAALGFIDDLMKIRKRGISSKLKFIGQCLITSYLLSYFIYSNYPLNLVFSDTIIPFWGKVAISPILLLALNFLTHISTSNATNLTDGQDGLLTQILIGIWSTLLFSLLLSQHWDLNAHNYPLEPFMLIALANLVTLLAFLGFNHYPAKIFMGDCGSLALGGALATTTMMMLYPFGLLLIAFVPVIETISVILQVGSYRFLKKRLFKMAPIHHHFELAGWHETTVTMRFVLLNTLVCTIAWLGYIRF